MSLTGALLSAQRGINKAESQLSVASANIANADKEGYTRKQYQEGNYVSVDGTNVASTSEVVRTVNRFLSEAAVRENSNLNYAQTMDEYLQTLDQALGSTTGESGISDAMNDLVSSMDTLAFSPEEVSNRINVLQAAQDLAFQLNRQSNEIQDIRERADRDMVHVVDEINDRLYELDELNEKIVYAQARLTGTADLEDERAQVIEELNGLMKVQYHTLDDNRIQVYSTGGNLLLGTEVSELSFQPTGNITSEETYPDVLGGVITGGEDILPQVYTGSLGALREIRDTAMVEEQEKLDELATELMDVLNVLHNSGTSFPANELYSGADGFALADSLAGSTGTFRVAVVDAGGTVVDFDDIDMTTIATVGDLVTAVDAIAGVNAFLDSEGGMVVRSTATGQGIAFSDMGTANVTGSGRGVSDFFELNNLFDVNSDNASNIRVREDLLQNPEYLSTASLSEDPAIAIGDPGLYAGDSSTATAMIEALETQNVFDAAGELTARNTSFQGYVNIILASSAERVEDAGRIAENAVYEYDTAKEALSNYTGINVDEELARITAIEDAYAASATVMQVVDEMFERLLNAVS